MKKHKISIFFLIIFSTIILGGIGVFGVNQSEIEKENHKIIEVKNEDGVILPLEEISKDYSLDQAKEDGCVVFENSDITKGEDIWAKFVSVTKTGEPASVRLAYYYTLEPEDCDPEYYEAEKDNYPVMYVKDLLFDGKAYTICWYEGEEKIVKSYKCLVRCEDKPKTADASFECCIKYVLTNDNTLTWDDIFKQMISSSFYPEEYIDYCIVYDDYVWE